MSMFELNFSHGLDHPRFTSSSASSFNVHDQDEGHLQSKILDVYFQHVAMDGSDFSSMTGYLNGMSFAHKRPLLDNLPPSTPFRITLLVFVSFVSLVVLRIFYEFHVRDRNIPPGPPRLPLIGNLHQAPKPDELPWLVYAKWAEQYGPIYSVQFGGNTFIMLADENMVHELLDKRGNRYSDRPRLVQAAENLHKGRHILFRSYDDDFKRHQRMEAPVLSPRASQAYIPLQETEARKTVFDFLSSADFASHFERYSISLIYALTYGFRVKSGSDPSIHEIHKVQDNLALAGAFGAWIVDAIPVLNHLPMWLAPWKRSAEEWYQVESKIHLKHMDYALERETWCWTKEFVGSKEGRGMERLEMAYDLGILADAGLDTTAAVLQVFVMAALTQPGFLKEAQKELDTVIGSSRTPTLDDRPNLPYLTACMREVFRWRTILPCTFPHQTQQQDSYMGYRIPANSTIIPLQWCMNLNKSNFNDPHTFDPSRWLTLSASELRFHAFGYGRRICPGRHIAENSVWLNMAKLIWGYDVTLADDSAGGGRVDPDKGWTTGFLTKPTPFKANFTIRSLAHEAVIRKEWDECEKDVDVLLGMVEEKRKGSR